MSPSPKSSAPASGPRKLGSRRKFGLALWQTQHAVDRAMAAALAPLEMTLTQVSALILIEAEPGISGAELARRLGLTAQSTGTLIAQLEQRGWAERGPHPMHRRVIETRITEQGDLALGTALGVVAQVDAVVMKHLSKADRTGLTEALDRCRTAAEGLLRG